MERIGEVIYTAPSGRGLRRLIAGGCTLAAHGSLVVALIAFPVRDPSASVARQDLHVVELFEPPPPAVPEPEPAPAPEPEPVVEPPPAPVARQVREVAEPPPAPSPEPAPSTPPPDTAGAVAPAQAGQVLARDEAPADEILDFTDFDVAVGEGAGYVGGVTSATGKNTVAVRGDAVANDGVVGASRGSLARPVGLPAANWDCPWPDDARTIGTREESVRLRVTVQPDGKATRVEVLSDPGHGFAEAARRCALQARFEPALDHDGRPMATTSPPIRVRFTR